jgi:hypothetical protein
LSHFLSQFTWNTLLTSDQVDVEKQYNEMRKKPQQPSRQDQNAMFDTTTAAASSPSGFNPLTSLRPSATRSITAASMFDAIDIAADEAALEQLKLRKPSPRLKASKSPRRIVRTATILFPA